MKKLFIAIVTAATLALSSAGFAGGVVPTQQPEEVVQVQESAWKGSYAGATFGQVQPEFGGDVDTFGVFAGHRHVLPEGIVIGAELAYAEAEDLKAYQAKLQGGVEIGNWLPYASVGYLKQDGGIEDTTYGVGVDYLLNDKWVVGGEYTKGDTDFKADAFQARLGYKF